jgi:hypothetical protein
MVATYRNIVLVHFTIRTPTTVLGRHGHHKIILQKNSEKINKFIKYFVEINKNEVNKNCRQKTKKNL